MNIIVIGPLADRIQCWLEGDKDMTYAHKNEGWKMNRPSRELIFTDQIKILQVSFLQSVLHQRLSFRDSNVHLEPGDKTFENGQV